MNRFTKACSLAFALMSTAAWPQTAIQPGTITGTFDAQGYNGTFIYTVPAGRIARVTDLMIVNYTDNRCSLQLNIGTSVRFLYIDARDTKTVAFNTGFGMLEGQTVYPLTICGDNSVYVQLRGFYFTIP